MAYPVGSLLWVVVVVCVGAPSSGFCCCNETLPADCT